MTETETPHGRRRLGHIVKNYWDVTSIFAALVYLFFEVQDLKERERVRDISLEYIILDICNPRRAKEELLHDLLRCDDRRRRAYSGDLPSAPLTPIPRQP